MSDSARLKGGNDLKGIVTGTKRHIEAILKPQGIKIICEDSRYTLLKSDQTDGQTGAHARCSVPDLLKCFNVLLQIKQISSEILCYL